MKNIIQSQTKTIVKFINPHNRVSEFIQAKYCVRKVIRYYSNFMLSSGHLDSPEFYDKDLPDAYHLAYNIGAPNIMMYLIFASKYPKQFRIIRTKDGRVYLPLPKLGSYIRIYKNNIITARAFFRQYESTDNEVHTGELDDSYTVVLDIVGPNAGYLYEAFEEKSNFIKNNSSCFVENSNSILLYKISKEKGTRWSSVRYKSLDNIIINETDKNNILDHLKVLDHNASVFNKINVQRRVGILLYGPAGTGKSSLAYSLAALRNTTILSVQAEDIANKRAVEHINDVDYGIILIEEIDGLLKDDSDNKNVILLRRDQVLDFLDSIPGGKIIIGTTNHIERLDDAVIRPGRFDVKVKMDYFSRRDAEEFISKVDIYDLSYMLDWYEYPLCPAQLQSDIAQEILKAEFNSITNKVV